MLNGLPIGVVYPCGPCHVPAELPRRVELPFADAGRRERLVVEDPRDGGSHVGRLVGIDEQSRIAEHLWQRPAVRGDDRHADRHRLEHRDAEALLERRLHEETRAFVQRATIRRIDVADVANAARERRAADALEPRPATPP